MATITEDYVSFEIAKLLKEKGFDEDCWCWYEDDGYFRESNDYYGFQSNSCHIGYDFNCSAPTLQMAMKWLREVRHIFLSIQQHMDMSYVWYAYMDGFAKGCDRESHNNTYEQACEAAIKYCLKKLI